MSSGSRELQFNPLERMVSTDLVRAQDFAACAVSEMLRALLDTNYGTDDVLAGGAYLPNFVQAQPLVGEILGGLVFVPNVGSVGSLVTTGVACVYDPDTDASTDDSQYKQIQDLGTNLLVLTANTSGNARIDVVECARVQPDNVFETDSRDVFNTVTGLFMAVTVNKVTAGQFQYRIRLGTPGSGFPGTAQGWLPLAVALVPNGATVWDPCTVWDVRPLIDDRIFGVQNVSQDLPRRTKLLYSSSLGAGTQHIVSGVAEANAITRRVGGRIQRGTPGTDLGQPFVDFSDGANQEAGLSLVGTNPALIFYYLCTPFGLPRWSRYTDAAAGIRVPRSPRGIPVISKVPPSHVYGISTAAIDLPDSLEFDGQTSLGVCFGATTFNGGQLNIQTTSDGWTSLSAPVLAVTSLMANTTIAVGSDGAMLPQATIHVASTAGFLPAGFLLVDGSIVTYTGLTSTTFTGCAGGNATLATSDWIGTLAGTLQLQENIHYPAGATRLRLAFGFTLGIGENQAANVTILAPQLAIAEVGNDLRQFSLAPLSTKEINVYNPVPNIEAVPVTWIVELEVPNHYPLPQTGDVWDVNFLLIGSYPDGVIIGSPRVQVLGWKYE